jgi:hypothetical protein
MKNLCTFQTQLSNMLLSEIDVGDLVFDINFQMLLQILKSQNDYT